MIKIINSSNHFNPLTFDPELTVTLVIQMLEAQDQMAIDPKFYENFGREIFKQIDESLKD